MLQRINKIVKPLKHKQILKIKTNLLFLKLFKNKNHIQFYILVMKN